MREESAELTASHDITHSLKAVGALSLLADDVHDRVDELSSFGVVTLGPIVSGRRLTKDVRAGVEQSTERASFDDLRCHVA